MLSSPLRVTAETDRLVVSKRLSAFTIEDGAVGAHGGHRRRGWGRGGVASSRSSSVETEPLHSSCSVHMSAVGQASKFEPDSPRCRNSSSPDRTAYERASETARCLRSDSTRPASPRDCQERELCCDVPCEDLLGCIAFFSRQRVNSALSSAGVTVLCRSAVERKS